MLSCQCYCFAGYVAFTINFPINKRNGTRQKIMCRKIKKGQSHYVLCLYNIFQMVLNWRKKGVQENPIWPLFCRNDLDVGCFLVSLLSAKS